MKPILYDVPEPRKVSGTRERPEVLSRDSVLQFWKPFCLRRARGMHAKREQVLKAHGFLMISCISWRLS